MTSNQAVIRRFSGIEKEPETYHTQLTMQDIINVVDSRIELHERSLLANIHNRTINLNDIRKATGVCHVRLKEAISIMQIRTYKVAGQVLIMRSDFEVLKNSHHLL